MDFDPADWHLQSWTDAQENTTAVVGVSTPPIREIVRARWKVPVPWLLSMQLTPTGLKIGDALDVLVRVTIGAGRVSEPLGVVFPIVIAVPNVPVPIAFVNPTNAIGGWVAAERITVEWSYVLAAIDPGPRRLRLWASLVPFGVAGPGGGAQ
jgi:hypothetical protein